MSPARSCTPPAAPSARCGRPAIAATMGPVLDEENEAAQARDKVLAQERDLRERVRAFLAERPPPPNPPAGPGG
jgi:hypothetical protein